MKVTKKTPLCDKCVDARWHTGTLPITCKGDVHPGNQKQKMKTHKSCKDCGNWTIYEY